MVTAKDIIKGWFKNKKKPTQEQFWAWIDSFWHKEEEIPIDKINGLTELLNSVATSDQIGGVVNLINELQKEAEKGMKNDTPIQLEANVSYQYSLPENSNLFAVKVKGSCLLKIGSSDNADDLGEINTAGVIQLGFIDNDIWLTANESVEIIPIVYKF